MGIAGQARHMAGEAQDRCRVCLTNTQHIYNPVQLAYNQVENKTTQIPAVAPTTTARCLRNEYGPKCHYCVPTDSCTNGHFVCDPITGDRICLLGWTGSDCRLRKTENNWFNLTCPENRCRNGGQCVSGRCCCMTGYTGELCQSEVIECQSQSCRNGGRCLDYVGRYECLCPVHFTGRNCETTVDVGPTDVPPQRASRCLPHTCRSGGTCYDVDEHTYCYCPTWYTGDNCETSLLSVSTIQPNLCPENYYGHDCKVFCKPHDSCYRGHYVCDPSTGAKLCQEGWRGNNCESRRLSQGQDPGCSLNITCKNGGHCFKNTCCCPPPFVGEFCHIESIGCASQPCLNGGSCIGSIAVPGGFSCACASSFTGTTCDKSRPSVSPEITTVVFTSPGALSSYLGLLTNNTVTPTTEVNHSGTRLLTTTRQDPTTLDGRTANPTKETTYTVTEVSTSASSTSNTSILVTVTQRNINTSTTITPTTKTTIVRLTTQNDTASAAATKIINSTATAATTVNYTTNTTLTANNNVTVTVIHIIKPTKLIPDNTTTITPIDSSTTITLQSSNNTEVTQPSNNIDVTEMVYNSAVPTTVAMTDIDNITTTETLNNSSTDVTVTPNSYVTATITPYNNTTTMSKTQSFNTASSTVTTHLNNNSSITTSSPYNTTTQTAFTSYNTNASTITHINVNDTTPITTNYTNTISAVPLNNNTPSIGSNHTISTTAAIAASNTSTEIPQNIQTTTTLTSLTNVIITTETPFKSTTANYTSTNTPHIPGIISTTSSPYNTTTKTTFTSYNTNPSTITHRNVNDTTPITTNYTNTISAVLLNNNTPSIGSNHTISTTATIEANNTSTAIPQNIQTTTTLTSLTNVIITTETPFKNTTANNTSTNTPHIPGIISTRNGSTAATIYLDNNVTTQTIIPNKGTVNPGNKSTGILVTGKNIITTMAVTPDNNSSTRTTQRQNTEDTTVTQHNYTSATTQLKQYNASATMQITQYNNTVTPTLAPDTMQSHSTKSVETTVKSNSTLAQLAITISGFYSLIYKQTVTTLATSSNSVTIDKRKYEETTATERTKKPDPESVSSPNKMDGVDEEASATRWWVVVVACVGGILVAITTVLVAMRVFKVTRNSASRTLKRRPDQLTGYDHEHFSNEPDLDRRRYSLEVDTLQDSLKRDVYVVNEV